MIKTVDIAKDIIFLCRKYKHNFNNTKVQKLIYLFIGFALVNDVDEIKKIDELAQAWHYGPVFAEVYKNFPQLLNEVESTHQISIKNNKKMLDIMEKTVKLWGRVSASKLSEWSHKENSPWDLVSKNKEKWNSTIPLEMIYNYFAENVENVLEEEAETGFLNFIKKIFN